MTPDIRNLLGDLQEYMDQRADIADRHDGTVCANQEMSLSQEIERILAKYPEHPAEDLPSVDAKYQPLWEQGARALCIKDDPPMQGFGRSLIVGDVVEVQSVCWNGSFYQLGIAEACAFYKMEDYFLPFPNPDTILKQ